MSLLTRLLLRQAHRVFLGVLLRFALDRHQRRLTGLLVCDLLGECPCMRLRLFLGDLLGVQLRQLLAPLLGDPLRQRSSLVLLGLLLRNPLRQLSGRGSLPGSCPSDPLRRPLASDGLEDRGPLNLGLDGRDVRGVLPSNGRGDRRMHGRRRLCCQCGSDQRYDTEDQTAHENDSIPGDEGREKGEV